MNALEETGLEYDDQLVNIGKGEQKRPEYLAVHPDGKVPALAVDDEVLTENPSILMFLHGIAPLTRSCCRMSGAPWSARGRPRTWCGAPPPCTRWCARSACRSGSRTATRAACRPRRHEYLHGVCARVDERLDGNDWWYGADWSIVDVYLRWLMATAASAGFDVQNYANIVDLVERVQQRPSFQRAQAREDAARSNM